MFFKIFHNKKGMAAVELAVVAPVLLLILFGTIEMGLLLYNKQVLTNASREGARAAIVSDVETNPLQIVLNYCNNHMINLVDGKENISEANICVHQVGSEFMDVSVSYHYHYLFVSLLGLSDTTISARTTMRIE